MRSQLKDFLIHLLFTCLLATHANAQVDPQFIERATKVINSQIDRTRVGAVVGIYDQGKLTYLSFGKKGVTSEAPDLNTIFEIGSITKTFTSLLFSIAIDKGLVKPETTLADIRPEWKKQKLGDIKLIELATHRAGLMRLPCDFNYTDASNPYGNYTEQQLINSINDEVIASAPDCQIKPHPTFLFEYSNWGSALLGNAIAASAGSSYPEILRRWITEPLGMRDTVITLSSDQKLRAAQGHTKDLKPVQLQDRRGMLGNGAIFSTASDLIIYAKAMLEPNTTPFSESIKRVQTVQYSNIAYNWFVTPGGSIWHDGMTSGFSSLFKAYLKKDFAIFALSNTATKIDCLIEAVENVPCSTEFNTARIELFLKNLNSVFGKKVSFNSDCNDLEGHYTTLNGTYTINICKPVLTLVPEESVILTVVAHEYAHILVDEDLTQDAWMIRHKSVKEAAKYIELRLNSQRLKQVELSRINPDQTIERLILNILQTAEHENMDSLGTKLLLMNGFMPDLETFKIMIKRVYANSYSSLERFIKPRTSALFVSQYDDLQSWSNFRCIGKGYSEIETNKSLKQNLPSPLVKDFTQSCDNKDILDTFYKILDAYYPLEGSSKIN